MKATHNALPAVTVRTDEMPKKVTVDEFGTECSEADIMGDKDYYVLKLSKTEVEVLMIMATRAIDDKRNQGKMSDNFNYFTRATLGKIINKNPDDFDTTKDYGRVPRLLSALVENTPPEIHGEEKNVIEKYRQIFEK